MYVWIYVRVYGVTVREVVGDRYAIEVLVYMYTGI